jgi:hypothetical protein
MVTYSLSLDDFDVDDGATMLNEHGDAIHSDRESFDATDADGTTSLQDVQENLKFHSVSDVAGEDIPMCPGSSVDEQFKFFMSPSSSFEDDESDADSVKSLLRMPFVDDEFDVDSLSMSSAGSSLDDMSDAHSVQSLIGLAFVDDEFDVDSLSMSPVSCFDEELALDGIVCSASSVEEIVTPSVLFPDGCDEREIAPTADVGDNVFITVDKDENRARLISLGCQTVHGLSLMLLLTFEQITLPVFVAGFLFMRLSMMMPGMQFGQPVGRPSPYDVVYLSCPVEVPLRGVKLATIEEDVDGEVDDEEEHSLPVHWTPLVPLRGVKLATIEEGCDEDVNEEERDNLHRSLLVPSCGGQLHTTEADANEERPQELPEQEENDDSGPNIFVDDDDEDHFEEAATPSNGTKPTVPLLEVRRSARIAAKAREKLTLPVGTEGSLFVNGKRRSARLSLF